MQDQEKIKSKIKALLSQADSEAKEQIDSSTGESAGYTNLAASLAFAAKARELAAKYHLDLNELKQKQQETPTFEYIPPEVGESIIYNPLHRANAIRKPRMHWFEELAKVVAKGFYCKAGVNTSGNVFIVGLDFDREIAEMVFLSLAQVADKFEPIELKKAKSTVGVPSYKPNPFQMVSWPGDSIFTESFHAGFREQIEDLYQKNQQDTSSIAVEEYWSKNYSNYWNLATDIGNHMKLDETAKLIGKNAGKVLSKKVGATKEVAINKQQELMKQQTITRSNLDGTEIIVVLDSSGSLGEELMQEAKKGAENYAREVLQDMKTSVGLVIFDHHVRTTLPPNRDLVNFNQSVRETYSRGSTDMILALNSARVLLKSKGKRQVIMLITDGLPDDYNRTIQLAKDIKRQGIEIMAIGTSGCNQEFLDKLCSKKGMGMLVSNNDFGAGIRKMAGMLNS